MAEAFLGEIRIVGFNFAPTGWAQCDGQLLSIAQNTALFALLGTIYGGNGITNFALPNLQERTSMMPGQNGDYVYTQGESGGTATVTLLAAEIPAHTHAVQSVNSIADDDDPGGSMLAAASGGNLYTNTGAINTTLAPTALSIVGNSQPHSNMQPYLVMNFIIALQGDLPTALMTEITTRPVVLPDDLPFLQAVYASARAEELAVVPWTAAEKAAFLASQFHAQHTYYLEHYPGAEFKVILRDSEPVGRIYIMPMADELRLMEITLLPEHRRQGIGSGLMAELLARARVSGVAVRLHVESFNPAYHLYTRLGFRHLEDRGVYQFLEMKP